ncbi:DUF295 domain-containing protein [Heracleum sosnowskyi]|uniref:DUF295 domain-containing protein n=1 Tax=Heracleum sosnowskyi TaxID=360622 RepID=A0AAD8HYE3_9APIA|nr:DUF295 domain-containing protein [Heracleum sosnowskyi]
MNQLKVDVSFNPKQRNTSCVIIRRVSWADIPADILFIIFGILRDINHNSFLDLYQCLAVCRSWRFVAKQIWRNHILPTTPWLLQEDDANNKIVFNTNPYKWHKHLRLDTNDEESSFYFDFNSYGMKIYASYDGWLLLGTSMYQPLLYNPVTKLLLQLPPLPGHLHLNFHMKFVSSRSRPTDPNCIICLKFSKKRDYMNCSGTTLMFCKPASSTSWLRLEENVEDFIFCGGQFYAIAASGALSVYNDDVIYGSVDPYTSRTWRKMEIGSELCGNSRSVNDVHRCFFYLVESKTGEMLMIKRIFERRCYTTKSFCIFKLKYRSDTIYGHYNYCYWDEISSLSENEALLLGWNDCISISMDEQHDAYKSNCIYFYDEDTWGKVMAYGIYDFRRRSILKKSEESDLYYCRFFNPSKPSNL